MKLNVFDGKNSKKLEFLESERKKLWERILLLEKQIAEKPSAIEKEAKQASRKASEYRNRVSVLLTTYFTVLRSALPLLS